MATSEGFARRASLLALAIGLALPSVAFGAELTEAEATKLFTDGLARFDAGDPRGAADTWERVLADGDPSRSWRILYNLGLAYEAAGDRPRSLERFEAFVRKVGEQAGAQPPEIEARRQDAVERANAMRPLLGKLRILRSGSGERVAVRVQDGAPREAPFDQYAEPGVYDLQMGDGPRAVRTRVELRAGETVDLTARLLPAPEPPSLPRTIEPPPPREPLVHPAILIGGASLTAVSIALPIGLFFQAKSLRADAEQIPRVYPEYEPAREKYEDFRSGYLASWALPAVLGTATLSLLVATVVDAQEGPKASFRVGPAGASVAIELE